MPYASKAQHRLFRAMESRGELPKGTASRWMRETAHYESLPEYVSGFGADAESRDTFYDLAILGAGLLGGLVLPKRYKIWSSIAAIGLVVTRGFAKSSCHEKAAALHARAAAGEQVKTPEIDSCMGFWPKLKFAS